MTVWYAGRKEFRPAYQTVIYTECHISGVALIQLILMMMGTWLPETCRELKSTYKTFEHQVGLFAKKEKKKASQVIVAEFLCK